MYGFDGWFVDRVMTCVSTARFSFQINGSLEGLLDGKRGLRQGDPLSPYLFVLCMDYFTRLLRRNGTDPKFSYHPKCKKLGLIQLGFVDDLMLFCKANVDSLQVINKTLQQFSALSGLQVNIAKSSIFLGC